MDTLNPSESASRPTRHEFLIMLLVILIASLIPFSTDSYTPSLPAITHYFKVSPSLIQLTITWFLLGLALGQLIYGPLSDRFGRRYLVLTGILICFFGSLLCAIAPSPYWLIAARFIQGLGASSANVLHRAIVRDTFHGNRLAKIISYIGMAFTTTLAAAPIIGGYIESFLGWRANFIFVAFFCVTTFTLLLWLLPETNQYRDKEAARLSVTLKNYLHLLTHTQFLSYTICSGLAFSGLISYYAITPFLFQNVLKFTPSEYGWLSIFLASSIMLGLSINARCVEKYGSNNMLFAGIVLMILAGITMLVAALLFPIGGLIIMLPTIVFAIGCGCVFANAMTGAFMPFGKIAGTAGAVYGFLQTFSAFVTSLLVSTLHSKNQIPMSLIYIGLGLACVGLFYFFIRKK
jgi:DHA1 family 2-module integral membrane pump EmrD-like MFS transporter